MAALDLSGFVTPEQGFGGLYKLGDDVGAMRQQEQETAKREQARKAASGQFLANYLDPKDFLTGTKYDPVITKGVYDLLEEGMKLAQTEGMDNGMIAMALSPKISKLSQQSQGIKAVNGRIKEQLALIPNNAGYNKQALEEEAKKAAFMSEEGGLRDMGEVDVDSDYIAEAVQRNPLGVTNVGVFSEALKDFEPTSIKATVKRPTDKKGGFEKRMSLVKTKGAFQYDEEEGAFVPKYEIARDGDKVVEHEFVDKDGKKVKAPVRMVTDDVYYKMMQTYPAIADRIRGEMRQYLGQNVDLNSSQAKNIGKTLMYENLKPLASGTVEDIEEIKAPVVNVRTGGSGSSQGSQSNVKYVEAYKNLDALASEVDYSKKAGTALTGADAEAQIIVLDYVNKVKGKNATGQDWTQADVYIRKEGGNVWVMDANKLPAAGQKPSSDAYIAKLSETGVDTKANQPYGVKAKTQAIGGGNKPAQNKDPLGIL